MKSLKKASLVFCCVLATSGFALAQKNTTELKPTSPEFNTKLHPVYEFDNGPAPCSVAVTDNGRIFVGFACSHETSQNGNNNNLVQNGYHCGLAELKYNGGDTANGQLQPYPNLEINRYDQDHPEDHFVDVRSIRVEGNYLWVLDAAAPENGPAVPGGAKLICINLNNDQIDRTIRIPDRLAKDGCCLKEMALDMRAGNHGMAFISDSSPSGHSSIIVVDLDNGHVWRRLHDTLSVQAEPDFVLTAEGQQLTWSGLPPAQLASVAESPADQAQAAPSQSQSNQPVQIGVEGLAVSNDGGTLYYAPLCSDRLYCIDTGVLCKHYGESDRATDNGAVQPTAEDQANNDNVIEGNYIDDNDREAVRNEINSAVHDCGDKGFPTDSMEFDNQGNLYMADVQNGIIRERESDGTYTAVMQGPPIAWPASLCIANDNQVHEPFMYFISTQYDRKPMFHNGTDERRQPYYLFRFLVSNGPSVNQ